MPPNDPGDSSTPSGEAASEAAPKVGTSTQAMVLGELLKERRDDRKRDERERTQTLTLLERYAKMWFYLAMAELAVLAMIVSGLLTVGFTGKIPGVGEIHITPGGGAGGTSGSSTENP